MGSALHVHQPKIIIPMYVKVCWSAGKSNVVNTSFAWSSVWIISHSRLFYPGMIQDRWCILAETTHINSLTLWSPPVCSSLVEANNVYLYLHYYKSWCVFLVNLKCLDLTITHAQHFYYCVSPWLLSNLESNCTESNFWSVNYTSSQWCY